MTREPTVGPRRRMRPEPRRAAARVLTAVLVAATSALGAGLLPTPGAAAPAIMPARAIAVGMTGVGKTVIIGTSVVQFDVRVLGILHNAGPAGDLVLFRASGPAIQNVGGIAAGMSGSPIYLQGKLAGALAYTFQASDPTVGMFTPIEDMLRVLPAQAAASPRIFRSRRGPSVYALAPVRVGGRLVRRVLVPASRSTAARDLTASASDTLVAVPAETPLFVSGIGGGGLQALANAFAPMGVVPIAGGSEANLPATLPLEPGSAIGVALLKGDIGAYAIGTMTYRDGNRMLGFGHPFTGIGPSSHLLMNATIFQVVRGQQQNIKVGAVGVPVGIISQDRPAGIGGTIGVMPRMFGVHVHVTDADSGAAQDFNFQVIPSTEIAPIVVPAGVQAAIERALNRNGQGTATVRMVLQGRGLEKPVVRENIFYGSNGIAARSLAELPQAMNLLFDNDFKDVGPTAIDMDVRITSHQETATIVEAEGPKGPVAAGDTVHVRVTVRPFRGTTRTEDVALTIPADAVAGPAALVVRGGGGALPTAAAVGVVGPVPGTQSTGPQTLADAVKAFETGDKNTDVVVELMGGVRPRTDSTAPAARPSAHWTTPWVVRGRLQIPIVLKGGTH